MTTTKRTFKVEPLIRSRQRVDAARLADPDTPVDALVAEGRNAYVR